MIGRNTMRHAFSIKAGAVLLLPFAIAACSERSSDSAVVTPPVVTTPPPTPAPASIQSRIGANFLAFFNAGNTTDPRDPVAADLPAVAPAADPLDN
jgi:hypothetical protein